MSEGPYRIKNIKANAYIGRSLYENGSKEPKSFFLLKPEEVGENAVFDVLRGINHLLWSFQSLESEVARAEEMNIPGTPDSRPAAFIVDYADKFWWEHNYDKGRDVIRDTKTKKVWTLPDTPGAHVTLEEEIEGDERQLWKLEKIE